MSNQTAEKKFNGRQDQGESDSQGFVTQKYYQSRNNNGRYANNNNRQRNSGNRQYGDTDTLNWRRSDNSNNRNSFTTRSNSGNNMNNRGYNQRSDSNDSYSFVKVKVTDPPAKKIVEKFRSEILKDCEDLETNPSLMNGKISYSRNVILKLSEVIKSTVQCPFEFVIFEKKIIDKKPEEEEEELDENCWDVPTNDFALDAGADILESGRIAFREQNMEESNKAAEEEKRKVEEDFKVFEESGGGESLMDMLSKAESQPTTPKPDEDQKSPITPKEEETAPVQARSPINIPGEISAEGEQVTEADILKMLNVNPSASGLHQNMHQPDVAPPMRQRLYPEGSFPGMQMSYPNNMRGVRGARIPNDPAYYDQRMLGEMPRGVPMEYRRQRMGRLGGEFGDGMMDPRMRNYGMSRMQMGQEPQYVPNRFFRQFNQGQQPDLQQMFEENDRQRALREQRARQMEQAMMQRPRPEGRMGEYGMRMEYGRGMQGGYMGRQPMNGYNGYAERMGDPYNDQMMYRQPY